MNTASWKIQANMACAAVFGLAIVLPPSYAVQMCTDLGNLKGVEEKQILPDCQIVNLTLSGIMLCSRACLNRRRCKSFNFNMVNGECQLNSKTNDSETHLRNQTGSIFSDIYHWFDKVAGGCANHSCPLNSYCEPVNKTYVCKITGCLGRPPFEHGQLRQENVSEESTVGTVLLYTCDRGYLPRGQLVCQDDGTWSSPVCQSVSSCGMVKLYQPDSEDGEYWLRLTNFDNYITKIYCHLTSTSTPKEYLTLPNRNYGIYPPIQDGNCDGIAGPLYGSCVGEGGEIWFHKIKVDIMTMEVATKDTTFANISGNKLGLEYGMAFDCYTNHINRRIRCGTKGNFTIDLGGTGWRVSEDQQWETTTNTWNPVIERIDRQRNGTVITLHCGGWPGGCVPSGGLFLVQYKRNMTNLRST